MTCPPGLRCLYTVLPIAEGNGQGYAASSKVQARCKIVERPPAGHRHPLRARRASALSVARWRSDGLER